MRFKKAVWMLALAGAVWAGKTASAQGSEAFWEITQKSLNQYLAEGWKIVGMNYQSYGNGVEYLYTLQKETQAVQCDVFKRPKKEPEVTCISLSGGAVTE